MGRTDGQKTPRASPWEDELVNGNTVHLEVQDAMRITCRY